jgi:hypothetical protein
MFAVVMRQPTSESNSLLVFRQNSDMTSLSTAVASMLALLTQLAIENGKPLFGVENYADPRP